MKIGWAGILLSLVIVAAGCSPSEEPSKSAGVSSRPRRPFVPRPSPPLPLPPASPVPLPDPPGTVSVGITAWNIERFDGAGEGDETFPRRTGEHLKSMARVLLGTSPAVIGLEEIDAFSEFTSVAPVDQIVAALNEEASGGGGEKPWQGFAGQIPGLPQRLALLWNRALVEPIAIRELSELRVGYTKAKRYPVTELRFPRIPLAGRFRLKAAPAFDFTVVVMHLKATDLGFENGLDENDIRRRGEVEDFLFKWALRPEAQGDLRDEEMAVMGDLNETAENLVYLLDQYGTTLESRGLLALTKDDLRDEKAVFFFADGEFSAPAQYTFIGNAEKGEKNSSGMVYWRDTIWSDRRSFIDHILLSRALAPRLAGPARPVYFDRWYPVAEYVHFSDHRPITIRLVVPVDYRSPSAAAPAS